MAKRATNDIFVKRLMNNCDSVHPVIMQAFVMTALENYSELVQKTSEEELKNGIIAPWAWKACAEETLAKMKTHLA